MQTGIGIFSRIPMAKNVIYAPGIRIRVLVIFLIGWLLALILVGIYFVTNALFTDMVAIALMMTCSVMLTGALHEDGLADTCDGFWGGLNVERKIDIMKDSRIGTYGACALILVLGLKFTLLFSLSQLDQMIVALLIAYPFSRALALSHVQDFALCVSFRECEKKQK